MKKYISLLIVTVLFLVATHSSNAQDVVDFGDSGIEIVVEASGDGMETGWAYWFPDEFYSYMPAFPRFPVLNLPPWSGGGGGGGDDGDSEACNDAMQKVVNLTYSIALNEATEHEWTTDGQIVKDDGTVVPAGSQEYNDMMTNLKRKISKLADQLWKARQAAKDAC